MSHLTEYKGLLASNVFTVANWKRIDPALNMLQDEFMHGVMPNYNEVIYGWINEEVDPEYETEVIKRFTNPAIDEERLV